MIEDVIEEFVTALNSFGGAGVAHFFDVPAFALSNHDTVIFETRTQLTAGIDAGLKHFADQSLTDVRVEKTSEIKASDTLSIVQVSKSVQAIGSQDTTDPWTEYWVFRTTPDGPKVAGILNFFGSNVDVSPMAVRKKIKARAASVDGFLENYRRCVEQSDLVKLGQAFEFPAIAVIDDYTRITPDFPAYLQFSEGLRDKCRSSGLTVSCTIADRPRAVGADLILAPVSLRFSMQDKGEVFAVNQILCLCVGDDGISCVAVINALDGTLARMAQPPVR